MSPNEIFTGYRVPRNYRGQPAFWKVQLKASPSWEATGATKQEAQEKLLDTLLSYLGDDSRYVMQCEDGTVLIASHFGYEIHRDGTIAGGYIGEPGSRHNATQARRHAAQSYGGVKWASPSFHLCECERCSRSLELAI